MFKLTWKTWLGVMLGLSALFGGLYALIGAQVGAAGAYWTGFAGAVVGGAWAVFGLIRWREAPWVRRVNTFALATLGFGALTLLLLAVDWEPGYTTALYCYFAVVGFLVGVNAVRLLLRPGHPVLGVARTMLEESLRMGVALIFIVFLLALLPILPLVFGSEDRVTYMVQRFLTYSTVIVFILLGLMTVLLSARSVSLEIASRQAHMTLTKPLGRSQYLMGKWLGIVLLNAVLVSVAGVAIYGFTMGIARNPALNDLDRYAVDREVLTARVAQTPSPVDVSWQGMYQNVLQEKQLTDPGRFGETGVAFAMLADDAKQEVIADTVSRFYTVKAGTSQEFLVSGLEQAAAAAEQARVRGAALLVERAGLSPKQADDYVALVTGQRNELEQDVIDAVSTELFDELKAILEREVIQLSMTPSLTPNPENQRVEFFLEINGQPYPRPATPTAPPRLQSMVVEIPNELAIPAGLVASDGTMRLTITPPETKRDGSPQQFVNFNYKDAQIEVYYRVGTFEGNLFRAMAVLWLKLAFLAMVGLIAGALLSFPVAAMLGLIVFVAAALSGYINESLDSYASVARDENVYQVITGTIGKFFSHLFSGQIYDAFRMFVRLIGESFMALMPSFGQFATAEPLSSGQVIGNDVLLRAFWKIGLLWTGVVAVLGLTLFTRKEIARIQV
ncbi:MAG: ABC transporter permease [Phycisphaeraceae bacterium]